MIEGRLDLLAGYSIFVKFTSSRTGYIIITFVSLVVKDLLVRTCLAESA